MPKRSRTQLLESLSEQESFLTRSARDYDEGHLVEAKRLAVTMRVLLHQTSSSHALLDQLALKSSLKWVATGGQVDPSNLLTQSSLTIMRMRMSEGIAEADYIAPLDDYPPNMILTQSGWLQRGSLIEFEEWWDTPVVKDSGARSFSRRALVLALSNQEGGAHVDPKVREAYDALANSNSLGWSVTDDRGTRPMESNPVFPSVRQIAHEVLRSLDLQRALLV